MKKVYTSACVIIPPKEIWGPIQEIRQQYDHQIHRWMPHITLLYPFRQDSEFKELKRIFSQFCKKIKPFEIILKNFNYFSHKNQQFTIWLEPETNELINTLQSLLLKIVPDCNDVNNFKGGFQPHLSVGQIISKKILNKTLKTLQSNWKELNFMLDRFFLISRENTKNSRFQIIEQISLK